MNATTRIGRVGVAADGVGLMSRVGTAAIVELANRVGLTSSLSRAIAGRTTRSSDVEGGRVLCDLVVMLADGGDAVTDLGVLRDQPASFGAVASTATAARVVAFCGEDLAGGDP